MNDHILNLNQSPEELNKIHGEMNYYWYLKSPQFVEAFIDPMAWFILGRDCRSVLDVACGEGILAGRLESMWSYVGFDGSRSAIIAARKRNPRRPFYVDRLENPQEVFGSFDHAVFGGVMSVLVKPSERVPLIRMYAGRYGIKTCTIYDLENLDTKDMEQAFGQPLVEHHATAENIVTDSPDVKLSRKILIYKVQ